MKKLIIITFAILLINQIGYGQKCNIETIKSLRINKDSLTDDLIFNFLVSIDESCQNNVEWSEASNWTLFWLADIETKRFIKQLKLNQEKIDIQLIIEEFKQPINDEINLVGIHAKITDLNDNDEIVLKILDSIKLAAEGLGLKIE